jgi:hypothetical protein
MRVGIDSGVTTGIWCSSRGVFLLAPMSNGHRPFTAQPVAIGEGFDNGRGSTSVACGILEGLLGTFRFGNVVENRQN